MEAASLATPSGVPGVLRPETSTSSEQAPCSSFCGNDAARNLGGGLLHTYLGRTSEDYQALVDVVLVTSEDRLPAHSQLLGLEAGVVAKTLITLKTPPSRQNPLVFDEPILRNSRPAAALRFLDMVYNPKSAPSGLEEALAVFKIADFLDAPRLLARLHEYMRVQGPVELVAVNGPQSPVKWLLEAEHPGLESFRDVCIEYIARHFGVLAHDPLLQQLTANSLVMLLHAVYVHTPRSPQPQPVPQQIRPRPILPRALLPPTPQQHQWPFAPLPDPYGPHGY